MDLVYNSLSDVFSYTSLRHSTYDTPWLNDSPATGRNYGGNKTAKDKCSDGKSGKDACPICQERQRRPLATYIRSKSRQDRKEECSIEEEEVEVPEEEESAQAPKKDNEESAQAPKKDNQEK